MAVSQIVLIYLYMNRMYSPGVLGREPLLYMRRDTTLFNDDFPGPRSMNRFTRNFDSSATDYDRIKNFEIRKDTFPALPIQGDRISRSSMAALVEKRVGVPLRTDIVSIQDEERPRLLVAIFSASGYADRRQAIRDSWLQDCDSIKKVTCKFFTDSKDSKGRHFDNRSVNALHEESVRNRGDLIMLNTVAGANFATRLLAVMEWARQNIEFDYLLRIDDDHFLCIDRLLEELPYRPRNRLYWGHLHCAPSKY